MRYVASGVWLSFVGQTAVSLSGLALSLVLSRYLTQNAYGDYKYILSLVGLLSTITLTGLGTAVFQSTARGYDGALREGFWLNLRWSVLAMLGAAVLAIYYFIIGNNMLGIGVLIGGACSPLLVSANLFTSFLSGKKAFGKQTLYVAIIGTPITAAVLALTALCFPNPIAMVVAYFASNTLLCLAFYYRTRALYRPDDTKTDPEMRTYSKHLSAMGILGGIAGNIDQVLLFHYVGAPALAVYNFATGILDQTKGPLKMLDSMTQARFANRTTSDIASNMRTKMLWLFFSSLTAALCYIIAAPYIYEILFPNYLAAIPYSRLYALSLLSLAAAPASSYLIAKKRVSEQYITTLVGSAIQILCMAIGVIWWGLWGLIIARIAIRLLGGYTTYALYVISAKHHVGVD